MKLVIDIPEGFYEEVRKDPSVLAPPFLSCEKVGKIIANGTPLPKGHGNLVDIGQCDRKTFYKECGGYDSLITVKSAFDMLMALPPIIKADKEGER